MSVHFICDCCGSIIFDEQAKVSLDITMKKRYVFEKKVVSLHLCDGCDMKVALQLISVLPEIARDIEPNVFNLSTEIKGQKEK